MGEKIRKINIVTLLLIMILLLTACASKSSSTTWQAQYDLGMQYLEEGDYAAAIVAFTAAIEIDAKETAAYTGRGNAYIFSGETEENLTLALADYETALTLIDEELESGQKELTEEMTEILVQAYLGIADVYIRQGEYDSALEILREGLVKTNDSEEIRQKIEEIETGNVMDSTGNLRRLSSYDGNGALMWYHEYTYNADGTRASVTSFDADYTQTGHVDIEYDENGREKVSFWYYVDDGTVDRAEYEYDASGNCIRDVIYGESDILEIFTYEYDTQGNIISYIRVDGQGILIESAVYEYNDLGQNIKENRYDPDGELSGYFTTEYDDDGQVSRYTYYDPDGGIVWTDIYKYDSQGNYIGYEEYDGDGNLTQSLE